MHGTLLRKLEGESSCERNSHEAWQYYSKRLVRDLEGKGIVRTGTETVNLALHADRSDVLAAECVRTFPVVTFPASLLLKREEIETGKRKGAHVITKVPWQSREIIFMGRGAS